MCWPTLTYLTFSVLSFIVFIVIIYSELNKGGFGTFIVFLIWVAAWVFQVYIYCKILTLLCLNDHKMLAWLLWLWLPLLNGAIAGVATVVLLPNDF